jgi:hypothetical protein
MRPYTTREYERDRFRGKQKEWKKEVRNNAKRGQTAHVASLGLVAPEHCCKQYAKSYVSCLQKSDVEICLQACAFSIKFSIFVSFLSKLAEKIYLRCV